MVSCMLVLLTQFAIFLVPRFLSASSFLIQLPLSGIPSLYYKSSMYIYSLFEGFTSEGFSFFYVIFLITALLLLVVSGLGRWCRRLLGVHASAPALVFFSILFLWCVYVVVIRKGPPALALSLFRNYVFPLVSCKMVCVNAIKSAALYHLPRAYKVNFFCCSRVTYSGCCV